MAPIETPKIHIEPTPVKVDVKIPTIPTIKIPEMALDIKAGSPAMSHYDGVKEDIHIGSVMRNKAGEALVVAQNDHGLLEWRSATPEDVARASLPLITNIQAGSPAAGGVVGSPKGTMAKNEKGEILVVDVVAKPDGRTVSEWRAATAGEIEAFGNGNVENLTDKWSARSDPQGTVTELRPGDNFVHPTDPTVDLRGPSPKIAAGIWHAVVDPVLDFFGIKPPHLSERMKVKVEGNLEFWLGVNPKDAPKNFLAEGGVVENLSNKAEQAVTEIYLTGRTSQDISIEMFDLVSTAKELGVSPELTQEVLFAHMARKEIGGVSFDVNLQKADDFKSAIEAARQSSGSADPAEKKAIFLLSIDPAVAEHFILEMDHQGDFFFNNGETRSFRDAQKLSNYIDQNGYPEPFQLTGDPALGKLFLEFFKPLDKQGLNDVFRAFGMPEERLVGKSSEGKIGQQDEVNALWDYGYEGYPLSVDNLHFEDDAMRFDGVEPLSSADVLDWEVGPDTRVDIQAGTDYYSLRYQAGHFEAMAEKLGEKSPEKTDLIHYAEIRAKELNREAAALDPTGELSNENLYLYLESHPDVQRAAEDHFQNELELRLGHDTVVDLNLDTPELWAEFGLK